MLTADYHVHTDFSSDSQTPMEQMVEQAIHLGLTKICFTDHMDFDYPRVSNHDFLFDPNEYFKKTDELKQRYHNKIKILTGIELGLQPHLSEMLTEFINQYPFDFIIGSSHVVDRMDPYYPDYWNNKSRKEGIFRYFESILENCNVFQGYHVYGHLDYIIRYVPRQKELNIDYSYSEYADILDDVLKTIIKHGKGIEVNSAGLKYGLGYAHPKLEVLKRYKELGGELITIGSDAHKPEHLAYDFHLLPDFLKEAGFQYYATFEKGKPTYEKL